MAFLVYLVLVLVSMHACDSRPLGIIDNKHNRLSVKDVKLPIGEEFDMNGKFDDKIISIRSEGDAKSTEEPILDPLKKCNNNQGNLGAMVLSNNEEVLQEKLNIIRGSKRQNKARLTLEDNKEEAVKSKENEAVEDVDVMDYAQPHRKPPIHNTKAP